MNRSFEMSITSIHFRKEKNKRKQPMRAFKPTSAKRPEAVYANLCQDKPQKVPYFSWTALTCSFLGCWIERAASKSLALFYPTSCVSEPILTFPQSQKKCCSSSYLKIFSDPLPTPPTLPTHFHHSFIPSLLVYSTQCLTLG